MFKFDAFLFFEKKNLTRLVTWFFITNLIYACQKPLSKTDHGSSQDSSNENGSLCLTGVFGCDGKRLDATTKVNSSDVAWRLLESTKDSQWNGVGRYGNCTGSLLDVGGHDQAPAYIITNGHCIGSSLMDWNVVINKNTAEDGFHKNMTFSYFHDMIDSLDAYQDEGVVFGTMHNTDVAIVQMPENFGFYRQKFKAYQLSSEDPVFDQKVTVVGVPLTGISQDNLGLHQSFCEIKHQVSLKEGPYHFNYAYQHTCSIVGGNSGSPIFDQKTGKIVALVNTAVDDGTDKQSDCTLSKPCEIQKNGKTFINKKVNYGQPVAFLSKCFSNGIFQEDAPGCDVLFYHKKGDE